MFLENSGKIIFLICCQYTFLICCCPDVDISSQRPQMMKSMKESIKEFDTFPEAQILVPRLRPRRNSSPNIFLICCPEFGRGQSNYKVILLKKCNLLKNMLLICILSKSDVRVINICIYICVYVCMYVYFLMCGAMLLTHVAMLPDRFYSELPCCHFAM